MADKNRPLTVADLAVTPVRELLKLAGELFVELLEAPAEFTEADRERARMLRLTLAEASSRAARVYPTPPNAGACSCGAKFATLDELDDHFWEVFVPADDTGLDGRQHAELSQD
jgi:hypothetical protein